MGFDASESNGGKKNHRKLMKPQTCQQKARTSDDLPPFHQSEVVGGKVMGNGRKAVNTCGKMQNDMDIQIHRLQIAAYSSVLRAFQAQSDVVTWEQESLMTELRRELNVSSEEHSELLVKAKEDGVIQKFRKMRQAGRHLSGMSNTVEDDGPVPSPISRKRNRVSPPASSLSVYQPSSGFHSLPIATPTQSSSVAAKRTAVTGATLKQLQSDQMLHSVVSPRSMQCHPAGSRGRGQVPNKKLKCDETIQVVSSLKSTQYHPVGSGGKDQAAKKKSYGTPTEKVPHNSLIGRKLQTRWPEDNNFYKALITDYNAIKGQHLLVYSTDTNDESWEWVNLKEIPPEDIIWEAEDPDINHRSSQDRLGQRVTESARGDGAMPHMGGGTRIIKYPPSQTGICEKRPDTIKILQTDALLKGVEKTFGAENPDPRQIEKAEQMIEEHKQSLIDAIATLANPSNGEDGKEM